MAKDARGRGSDNRGGQKKTWDAKRGSYAKGFAGNPTGNASPMSRAYQANLGKAQGLGDRTAAATLGQGHPKSMPTGNSFADSARRLALGMGTPGGKRF